jgi:c(7)-type cytochrome triheme protein
MRRTVLAAIAPLLLLATVARAEPGQGKRRRPLPPEYGRVVFEPSGPDRGKMAPVAFDHWLHRASFTCRLCHVDLGFAQKAGATAVTAADNEAGYYCGGCHDGKRVFQGKPLFAACGKTTSRDACSRCHSVGLKVKPEVDFGAFTRNLPRGRFGNGVDWEKAEEQGLIKPIDFLDGVSIKRQSLTAQKDFALAPRLEGMPEIIFSHKKHTVWSGCEGCHPDIFVGVKKGLTRYGMPEIFDGKYCGVCHTTVAFPTTDCQRCHTKAVQ